MDTPIARTRTYPTSNNLSDSVRTQMIDLLNQELANTADLHSQLKQAHWNVTGMHFYPLHLLFDKLAEEVEDYVDDLAERVTALGGVALGTVRMAAESSQLTEFPTDLGDGQSFVEAAAHRVAAVANSTRQGIDTATDAGDAVTADLLTEIARGLDKSLYFLEAHLR
ncbi:MAG: DNA starvation/stationary phase protection protein Dps [Anaerolineae bacterium]|nr:DNA starvation/stationary phase protection protein Dps [Anaerolineae bacterium]